MDFTNKNGTSLYKLYELVVLQKIRDAKPKKKANARSGLELHCDGFGQMIYAYYPQNMKHW
ncbi:hypothetical protein [Desulforamulus aeronauticus]|uniref:Uncharacterized protein n=1 Tax=Desulforamulus aeronauticus DSM 10349 TaxID=1121421 RepID=A0A1M6WXL7_9FIRM|nr:hypothetical protein [Desulforamulus aeronauticus]SHK98329.1 hypothetical protein SAMN02745123_03812 [Desulforamulus aeronauticus DSM 10349]